MLPSVAMLARCCTSLMRTCSALELLEICPKYSLAVTGLLQNGSAVAARRLLVRACTAMLGCLV